MSVTREPGHESVVKVAAIQTRAHTGDKEGNTRQALDAVRRACWDGVRLVVLPELGNSGYVFNSREEVAELAEPIGGETTQLWLEAAREHDVYICGGFLEVEARRFYNAALLVGPDGLIGHYRKVHLWDEEKLFFEPGDLGLNVFNLPFGRVGIMICYDGWHPEVARILKLKGADIILDPTCWVLVPDLVTPENPVLRLRPHGHCSRQQPIRGVRRPVRSRARMHIPRTQLYRGSRWVRRRSGRA